MVISCSPGTSMRNSILAFLFFVVLWLFFFCQVPYFSRVSWCWDGQSFVTFYPFVSFLFFLTRFSLFHTRVLKNCFDMMSSFLFVDVLRLKSSVCVEIFVNFTGFSNELSKMTAHWGVITGMFCYLRLNPDVVLLSAVFSYIKYFKRVQILVSCEFLSCDTS